MSYEPPKEIEVGNWAGYFVIGVCYATLWALVSTMSDAAPRRDFDVWRDFQNNYSLDRSQ